MRVRPAHVALGAVGLTAGVLGVGALREATLSTHHPVPPGSETAVLVRAEDRGAEPGQTLAEMVEVQLSLCRLEVTSDLVGHVEDHGGHLDVACAGHATERAEEHGQGPEPQSADRFARPRANQPAMRGPTTATVPLAPVVVVSSAAWRSVVIPTDQAAKATAASHGQAAGVTPATAGPLRASMRDAAPTTARSSARLAPA